MVEIAWDVNNLCILTNSGLPSLACGEDVYDEDDCCCFLDPSIAYDAGTTYSDGDMCEVTDEGADNGQYEYKNPASSSGNKPPNQAYWDRKTDVVSCGNTNWNSVVNFGGPSGTPAKYVLVFEGLKKCNDASFDATLILTRQSAGTPCYGGDCCWSGAHPDDAYIFGSIQLRYDEPPQTLILLAPVIGQSSFRYETDACDIKDTTGGANELVCDPGQAGKEGTAKWWPLWKTMYIHSCVGSATSSGCGGGEEKAQVIVTIKDEDGNTVENALVKYSWSGVISGNDTAITGTGGSSGQATSVTDCTGLSGDIVVTVDSVVKEQYGYVAADNNCDGDTVAVN